MLILSTHLRINWRLIIMAFFLLQFGSLIAQVAIQKPRLMVLPSDAILKRIGCLDSIHYDGRTAYQQQYQRALVNNLDLKFIITNIQERFSDAGFPLIDLEQSLKNLQEVGAIDRVSNIATDVRTVLLSSAKPDIVLEIDYSLRKVGMSNKLSFSLTAKDAYSLLSSAIVSVNNPGIETVNSDVKDLIYEQVELNLNNFISGIGNYFENLKVKGREIELRITLTDPAPFLFSDWCDVCADEYGQVIRGYVRKNALNGAWRPSMPTSDLQLTYILNIPVIDKEGFPMSASDWVNEMRRYFRANYNLVSQDLTRGLNAGHIMFK